MDDIDELFRIRARLLNEVETLSLIADTTSDISAVDRARKAIEGTFVMLDVLDSRIISLDSEVTDR